MLLKSAVDPTQNFSRIPDLFFECKIDIKGMLSFSGEVGLKIILSASLTHLQISFLITAMTMFSGQLLKPSCWGPRWLLWRRETATQGNIWVSRTFIDLLI